MTGALATASNPSVTGGARAEGDALMARYARGDQGAARALTDANAGRVLAVATRLLGDAAEAEDVAQEAFLRLWRIAPQWRPGEALVSTWLHRTATNLCIDRLRKRRPRDFSDAFPDGAPDIADDSPAVEEVMTRSGVSAAVRAALMALPGRQRAALVLNVYDGAANPDIAAALGVSVEAVESLLARGRRTLKRTLATARAQL